MISVPHCEQRNRAPTAVGAMRADYPATMCPMPALADLTLEVDDGVAVVTLTRPERRNAFTGAMGESLGQAYEWCDANDDVRAVVVTGAGDAFCAGAGPDAGG